MGNLNDCFVSVEGRLTIAEAVDRFSNGIGTVVGTEEIPLVDAVGRTLSSDLISGFNVPPKDNSAVDGYAIRDDNLKTKKL